MAVLVLVAIARLPRVSADVVDAPTWRLGEGITAAIAHRDTIYVGGSFAQLYTPATSVTQFYDQFTGDPRPQCARTTTTARGLVTTPDGRGGLLVVVQPDDAFADQDGAFVPPAGTTIVRIANTCLWDRPFAAPAIDPADAGNLAVGLPVRVGDVVYAANAIIASDGFLQAQVAAFDAVSGDRVDFRIYPGISEIGLLGAGPQGPVARVRLRNGIGGQYLLGSIAAGTLELTVAPTPLVDELLDPKFWFRGDTLYRARPAPANTLEAYDLMTLAPKVGWTAPVVPALADLEVVGTRVFLTAGTVNGQAVRQPSALVAATGAIDSTWTPPVLAKRSNVPTETPYTPVLTHLATDGARLYFSGDMERVADLDRDGVAALLVSSATVDLWDAAPVVASPLEFISGGLLMTRPTSTNRVSRRYLAAIDAATGLATPWDPHDFNRRLLHTVAPVSALATDGTYLYFATVTTGELRRAHLTTGDVDELWRFVVYRAGGVPGSIDTIVEHAGTLYLGGDFDAIAGTAVPVTLRRAVAAIGTDGSLKPWAPVLEGPVDSRLLRAMVRMGNTIYLGGGFFFVNGQPRIGFAAVDAVTHNVVQPEMVVVGDTWVQGLATDGARVFLAGETFGAPMIGESAVPSSAFTPFAVREAAIPRSAAYVAGGLYAGLEYDPDARVATSRRTRWNRVISAPNALLHLTVDQTLDYYTGLPGQTPGAPTLTGSVLANVVALAWTPSATGGIPSNYTLVAGSQPGVGNIATFNLAATTFRTQAPNGGYYIRVIPRNRYGPGTPSNEIFLRVGPEPCTVPPPAPQSLAFTVAGLNVRVTWAEVATATQYTLEAGRTSGAADLANFALPPVTSYAATAPPGVYFVRTRAHNPCGTSPPSNEVVITLGGPVEVPQPPTGLTAIVAGRNVALQWTPPTSGGLPSGFLLEAGNAPGLANVAVFQTTAPALGAANVPPATYYVRVRSFNSAGLGAPTADVVVVVQ